MLLVQRGSDKPMSDRICIEGLTVDGLIGVYPHELDRPQRLVVDLCAETDTRSAAHSERLVGANEHNDSTAESDGVAIEPQYDANPADVALSSRFCIAAATA